MMEDSRQYNRPSDIPEVIPAGSEPPERRRGTPWVKLAIILIIAGGLMTAAGRASGSQGGRIYWDNNSGLNIEAWSRNVYRGDGVAHFTSFDTDQLSSITVNATTANITIVSTSDPSPRITTQGIAHPNIQESGGHLTISPRVGNYSNAEISIGLVDIRGSFGRRGNWSLNWDSRPHARRSEVRVYVPQGMVIDDVNIRITSGRVTVEGVSGVNLDSRVTSGRMDFSQANFANVTLNSTSGNITFDGAISDALDARATSGNIRITDTDSTIMSATLRVSSGNIRYTTAAPRTNFRYDISVTSGTTRINGDRMAGRRLEGGRGDSRLNVSATSGNVHLDFGR